jgi:D-alanine transaminase
MSRTVYVNGSYLPEEEAKISIFDRGFLMADGVYEVTSVLDGKLIDFDGHLPRLARSLTELDMAEPVTDDERSGDPPRAGGAERPRPRA